MNGYFAVATEILNDSGAPHTLEHLIFMGSKKYPYKGLLDTLGNLAFSSTNAWTATDQTVYTLTSAGWEGFKMLLPIYLDHLVNPTLTDSACYTEVYHTDGEGKEKGVVFSEMQGIENQSWFLAGLEQQRTLYKGTGYQSETGGLLENLRKLTNDEIKKYHSSSYRPDNLSVIITGSVDPEDLLSVMDEFDQSLPCLENTHKKRPFVDSQKVQPLKQSIVKRVEFPDTDESMSEMTLAWHGPDARDNLIYSATEMLGTYLTESTIALLSKKFVEIDDPYATAVSSVSECYLTTCFSLEFEGVPTERLEQLRQHVMVELKAHCDLGAFDLVRMKQVLENFKRKYIFEAENSTDHIAQSVVEDFLYGPMDGTGLLFYKDMKDYEELMTWDAEKWCSLLRKQYIDNPSLTLFTVPSKKLYEKTRQADDEAQRERETQQGLPELAHRLKKAQEENDKEIPKEIIKQFGQPDPRNIKFIKTDAIGVGLNRLQNDGQLGCVKLVEEDTAKDFPLFVHVENIRSEFVSIELILSSFQLEPRLLPYLRLFEDVLFELPKQKEDGSVQSHESVVEGLEHDTVAYRFLTSFMSQHKELIGIEIQVPCANYHKAIDWLYSLMWESIFDETRIKVGVERILQLLPEDKRSGMKMKDSVMDRSLLSDRSLTKAKDCLFSEPFFHDCLEKIESGSFHEIKQDLEKVRASLFKSSNIRVLVMGQVEKLENPVSSWNRFTGSGSLDPLGSSLDAQSDLGSKLCREARLVSAPASDSTFFTSVSRIPTDYLDMDTFKIHLASEYLQAVEGPFWRGIRGSGLAYGANVYRDVELGYLKFDLYRSSDAERAFEVARDIVKGYASGQTHLLRLSS